ncbi:hypothetical protein TNCV_4071791 [Trichonephila clavipes]|uniref:Uncharacterized protein n=1 Tax=Trichonephila clavipes TaxID=2585209 RepID=A0A8X7BFK3_TRICX|nr:hypothetical protein TNCV_4071791 [Trichonephila clavipes]
MEYASLICSHVSCSTLDKMDTIQARAAKIIIGAVASADNVKSQLECGLQSLESSKRIQVLLRLPTRSEVVKKITIEAKSFIHGEKVQTQTILNITI